MGLLVWGIDTHVALHICILTRLGSIRGNAEECWPAREGTPERRARACGKVDEGQRGTTGSHGKVSGFPFGRCGGRRAGQREPRTISTHVEPAALARPLCGYVGGIGSRTLNPNLHLSALKRFSRIERAGDIPTRHKSCIVIALIFQLTLRRRNSLLSYRCVRGGLGLAASLFRERSERKPS